MKKIDNCFKINVEILKGGEKMRKLFRVFCILVLCVSFSGAAYSEELVIPLWEYYITPTTGTTITASTATTNFFMTAHSVGGASTSVDFRMFFVLEPNALGFGTITAQTNEWEATRNTVNLGQSLNTYNGSGMQGLTTTNLTASSGYNLGSARIVTNKNANTDAKMDVFVSIIVGSTSFSVPVTQVSATYGDGAF